MSIKRYGVSYLLLCIVALIAMFSTSLVNPLLSIFAKQVGAAGVMIGLSVAAYWVARVLLEIPSGFLSSRVGYYWPMLLGLVLTALGTFWNAYVTDPVQLILARGLQGFGAPLFFAVSMTMILNMFPIETRGSAMGFFQGIEFAGTIIGSTFSGFIITALGFQGGFVLAAFLCVISVVMILLPPGIRRNANALPKAASIRVLDLPRVFTNPVLLTVCFATLVSFIVSQGILFTVFPLYANGPLAMSLTDIGIIMGARSVGYVLSIFAMGVIADRLGRRPVLMFGIASTAVTLVPLGFASGFLPNLVTFFLLGITTGAVWIIGPVYAAEAVDPRYRGAAVGAYRTFFDLGSILGPIISMWIYGVYGASWTFYSGTLLLLVALIPTLWIAETKTKKVAEN